MGREKMMATSPHFAKHCLTKPALIVLTLACIRRVGVAAHMSSDASGIPSPPYLVVLLPRTLGIRAASVSSCPDVSLLVTLHITCAFVLLPSVEVRRIDTTLLSS